MNYQELIVKALKGRSVNSAAKAWGVPQPTLDSYVKGKTMPDHDVAEKIIQDAEVDPLEGYKTLATQTRMNKAAKFKLQRGFVHAEVAVIGATVNLVAMLSILCKMPNAIQRNAVLSKLRRKNHPAVHVEQTDGT